jgi:hypothetical protein
MTGSALPGPQPGAEAWICVGEPFDLLRAVVPEARTTLGGLDKVASPDDGGMSR